MKRTLYLIVLLVFFLAVFSSADFNTRIPCQSEAECQAYNGYYCNLNDHFCYNPEGEAAEEEGTEAKTETDETATGAEEAEAETSVPALEERISQLQQEIDTLKASLNSEQSRLNQVSRGLVSLQERTEEAAGGAQTVSTGLAGLQEEVQATQTEVEEMEGELKEEKSFTQLLKLIFFLVILGLAAVILVYFLEKNRKKVHPTVRDFITNSIRAGKKYTHIKEAMKESGWKEPEILHAYKETMKHNYQRYKEGKPARRGPPGDRNKTISLAVVSILLLFGIIFLLSGTVGKAFFVERYMNFSSGEIVDVVRCTPPQILTTDGDACCTDANEDSVCDYLEREVGEAGEGCTDNLQCSGSRLCINGQCRTLSGLYGGSSFCDQRCGFYSVSVRANDETYSYPPGLGSYTCVGALEWKVMKGMPLHCEGEPVIVPFKISKKADGKVLSEEVIALRERESREIRHPSLGCSLTLTLQKAYELCE